MTAVLPYFIVGAAIAVVAVLGLGIVNMVRKDHDPRVSNRLMRWRVGLQLGAVGLLIALLLLGRA